jgi:serine/threonine protein kinase
VLEIIGQSAGKYQILERVGQGGMSVIYKALDQKEDKTVAIKVLSAARAADPSFEARFAREIEVLQALKHRRILPILDYGDIGGLPFIVMPFYPHGTLRDRLDQGIALKDGARIINQVSEALEYAHTKGVTHRDVKPTNVLLTKHNNAVLSDFGFAHLPSSELSLTGSALIGTPAYMSPEQIRGKKITGASDQYSLAVAMYELVTGRMPFEADSPIVLVFNHLNDPVPDPREFNPYVTEEIADTLLKALNKNPKRRFTSVSELNQTFQSAVEEQSSIKEPQKSWRRNLHSSLLGIRRRASLFSSRLIRNPEGRRRARFAALISLFVLVPVVALAAASNGVRGGSNGSVPEATPTTSGLTGETNPESAEPTTVAALMIPLTGGDSDGVDGPKFTSTPTATPTPTVEPTNTPQLWFYPSPTSKPLSTATPTPTELPSMHVINIYGKGSGNPEYWNAEVKIWVVDDADSPVVGATVIGTWSVEGHVLVEYSCDIGGSGYCRIRNRWITSAQSTTFRITRVIYSGYYYDSSQNTDLDGDSDGTSIVILAPDD